MGVMQCNRGRCETISAERYSQEYGYICESCFDELVSRGVGTNIADFMATNPIKCNQSAIRSYFGAEFIERGDD